MPAAVRAASDLAPPPGTAPSWASRASGAWLWDAHGQRRLDMGCARGAVILGHDCPAVEAAAASPDEHAAELAAERLCARLPASAARFTRTAAEAEVAALAVAVRATDRVEVLRLTTQAEVAAAPSRLGTRDVAAVIVEPDLLHPPLAHALRAVTVAADTLLILDETTTGQRRAIGGAQAQLRIRADLSIWGAGLANGRPFGALTGVPELLACAPELAPADPSSLAAAAATLFRVAHEEAPLQLAVRGAELEAELELIADEAGLGDVVRVTGDPTWITLAFQGPHANRLQRRFTAQLAARGVHAPGPFAVGARHDDAEIATFLDAAAAALSVLACAEPRASAA